MRRRRGLILFVGVLALPACQGDGHVRLRGPATTAPADTAAPSTFPPPTESTQDTFVKMPPTTGIDLNAPAYTTPPTTKPPKVKVGSTSTKGP